MNKMLITIIGAAVLVQAHAQTTVDPYMGDWRGTLQVGDNKEQPVAVTMIPRGNGRYEAKFFNAFGFTKRVPVLHQLDGFFKDANFKFIDAIPFDASSIVGTTTNGVVFNTSLWSGVIDKGALVGTINGKKQGKFRLSYLAPRSNTALGQKPPTNATVLFDGKNLNAWVLQDNKAAPVKWKIMDDGSMQVNGGNIVSKESFGDHKLHIEFKLPYMPFASGQGRANSGVYLHGRYEVQVLDSYGLEGADNECGGIYQVSKPAVNMCYPPLQWQCYDITFRTPRFDNAMKKTANARITVVHNGVVIHDNIELPGLTGGAIENSEGRLGGLMLQDHGNPVQFRNIWVEKLN